MGHGVFIYDSCVVHTNPLSLDIAVVIAKDVERSAGVGFEGAPYEDLSVKDRKYSMTHRNEPLKRVGYSVRHYDVVVMVKNYACSSGKWHLAFIFMVDAPRRVE